MQFPMKITNFQILTLVICLNQIIINNAAPVKEMKILESNENNETIENKKSTRKSKAIDLYDFLAQGDFNGPVLDPTDYYTYDDTENEVLSRANGGYNTPRRHVNSPIYYIRLPPAPYMYVSGLGYVSHPPSVSPLGPTTNSFINLPISFVSNGKPSNVYQWSEGYRHPPSSALPQLAPPAPTPKPTQKPVYTKPDSTIHRLPGRYPFNGKPQDIVVLRDSYNSLYADALQNFYP